MHGFMWSGKARIQRGFTLIELMIVMVVIAILAAIAIPSYRQHVLKVKRADATTMINATAQRLERCYTRNNNYADMPLATNPECNFATAQTTVDGTYVVTVTRSGAGACAGSQCFVVTGTPQGAQASDTRCGTFTLDQAGLQGASGTDGAAKCW